MASKSAALRWGQAREAELLRAGKASLAPAAEPKHVPTLKEFAPRFIEEHARANRQKASGVATKEGIIERHLLPALGEKRLDEITDAEVGAFKARPSIRKLGAKSLNNVLNVLSSMLNVARRWRVIDAVPCAIEHVKAASPPMSFYDFDEYARLVAAARELGPRHLMLVLLGGDAGLRRGEMIALRRADLDMQRRVIHVRHSVWQGIEDLPKGGRERRVPMTRALAEALKAKHGTSTRVLWKDDGTDVDENQLQLWMKQVTERAGLPITRSLHILRHTFCSHLAMRGAPARAIQQLAGHASITTTERYMHLSPAAEESAIRLLDDAHGVATTPGHNRGTADAAMLN